MPYCNVFLIDYKRSPRNHQVIFIEVTTDGSGQGYNAIGNVADGMSYETKFMTKPEKDADFALRTMVGTVNASDIDAFGLVCESVRPPSNSQAGEVDGQDWVRDAIVALRNAGILRTL